MFFLSFLSHFHDIFFFHCTILSRPHLHMIPPYDFFPLYNSELSGCGDGPGPSLLSDNCIRYF